MSKKEYQYYVYILASGRNGTLYVGITANLFVRILQHKRKEDKECFTAKFNVNKLVYYESYQNVTDAIRQEKLLKKWRRTWKLELIERENPKWEDLSDSMYL